MQYLFSPEEIQIENRKDDVSGYGGCYWCLNTCKRG